MSDRLISPWWDALGFLGGIITLGYAILADPRTKWSAPTVELPAAFVRDPVGYLIPIIVDVTLTAIRQYPLFVLLALWILPGAIIRIQVWRSDSPRGDWLLTLSGPTAFRWTHPKEGKGVVLKPVLWPLPFVWRAYRYDHGTDREDWTVMDVGTPWSVTAFALTWMDNHTFFSILGVVDAKLGSGRGGGRDD